MSIFDKFKNYDESDEINKENKGRKNMINLKITRPTGLVFIFFLLRL